MLQLISQKAKQHAKSESKEKKHAKEDCKKKAANNNDLSDESVGQMREEEGRKKIAQTQTATNLRVGVG